MTDITHTCLLCILVYIINALRTAGTTAHPLVLCYSRTPPVGIYGLSTAPANKPRTAVTLEAHNLILRYTVHTGSGAHSLRSRDTKERGDDPFSLDSSPTQWRWTQRRPRRSLVLQVCRHLTRWQLHRRQNRPELFYTVTLPEAQARFQSRPQAFQNDLKLLPDPKLMNVC